MWYVYVLYGESTQKFYIGMTGDLKRRLLEHHAGHTQTTASMGKLELVYFEVGLSKEDAAARELQLKTGFGRGYLKRRLENYLRGRSSAG